MDDVAQAFREQVLAEERLKDLEAKHAEVCRKIALIKAQIQQISQEDHL